MSNQYKFFSDLIVRLPIKPDYQLVSKVDEITLPFQHCKAIKKNINSLFYICFTDFIAEFKESQKNRKSNEIQMGSDVSCTILFNEKEYRVTSKKVKRECPKIFERKHPSFDDRILDDDFVNEINRYMVLKSFSFGQGIRKTQEKIRSSQECAFLDEFVILEEIYFFWTMFYKHDFCYLLPIDTGMSEFEFEEKEIELGLLRFYVNQYEKQNIDLTKFEGDKKIVLDSVCSDTTNYRWFVILGFWMAQNKITESQIQKLKECPPGEVEKELDEIFAIDK